MESKLPLISLLKKPVYLVWFLLVFGGFFYLSYYLMSHLAGERDLMCVVGGGLTFENTLFSLLMSALVGFVVIGFVHNLKMKAAMSRLTLGSTSFLGLLFGIFTTFCTLCTLPVITFFGVSIGLSFFTDFELYFKVLSLILLSLSFYLINRALAKKCSLCVR